MMGAEDGRGGGSSSDVQGRTGAEDRRGGRGRRTGAEDGSSRTVREQESSARLPEKHCVPRRPPLPPPNTAELTNTPFSLHRTESSSS